MIITKPIVLLFLLSYYSHNYIDAKLRCTENLLPLKNLEESVKSHVKQFIYI